MDPARSSSSILPVQGDQAPSYPTCSTVIQIRDSVHQFLTERKFSVTPERLTAVSELYKHWRRFDPTSHTASNASLRHFQSALGRVLRPKSTEGAWKGVVKVKKMYGISTEEGVDWMDWKNEIREMKRDCGKRRRDLVGEDEGLKRKKEERRRKRNKKEKCEDKGSEDGTERNLVVHFGYIDEFVSSLKCAPDLLMMGLYPNGKELTESMSAFAAVRQYCMRDDDKFRVLKSNDKNVTLVAVGDGCTPRTAAMFAFRTNWRCISIDPTLRTGEKEPYAKVERLELFPSRVQDVKVSIRKPNKVVLVIWHAHVSLRDALNCLVWKESNIDHSVDARLRTRIAVVSCSCCNWDELQVRLPDGSPPDAEFEDGGVASRKRTIRVWRMLKHDTLSAI